MIRELSDRQSDVRELLSALRQQEDKTVEDGLAGNLGYSDDVVTAVVLATHEMRSTPEADIEVRDLIWAGAFLDNLDTLNMQVRPKKVKKHGKKGN